MEPTNKSIFQAVVTKAGRNALTERGEDPRDLSPAEVRDNGRVAIKEGARKRVAQIASVGLVACVGTLAGMKLNEKPQAPPVTVTVGTEHGEPHQSTTGASPDQKFQNEAVLISQSLGNQELPKDGITIQPPQ